MSRYPHVINDVNVSDLLILSLIRYKDINVYEAIVRCRIVSRGGFLTGSNTTMYLEKDYENQLEHLNATEKVISLLIICFQSRTKKNMVKVNISD